jgi:hypothetical protein
MERGGARSSAPAEISFFSYSSFFFFFFFFLPFSLSAVYIYRSASLVRSFLPSATVE